MNSQLSSQPVLNPAELNFEKGGGLVTVVAQDARSGAVLMIAHANREAMDRTLQTGEMHYFSRSRGLWHKGATSGNTQRVVSLRADCDSDAVLALVVPSGPACHNGSYSCFSDAETRHDAISILDATIHERANAVRDTPHSGEASTGYTQKLLRDRNLRLKKIGEESAELIAACADSDTNRAREEAADLLYHAAVALRAIGVSLEDVRAVLAARAK